MQINFTDTLGNIHISKPEQKEFRVYHCLKKLAKDHSWYFTYNDVLWENHFQLFWGRLQLTVLESYFINHFRVTRTATKKKKKKKRQFHSPNSRKWTCLDLHQYPVKSTLTCYYCAKSTCSNCRHKVRLITSEKM